MSTFSTRRVAAGAGAAMLGAVIAAGGGVGVANAAPTFVTPDCAVSNTAYKSMGPDQATFNISKEVEGDGVVVAGDTVVYTTVVAATKFMLGLESIADVHPAGFILEKAEVQAYRIPGMKQKWSDETSRALHDGNTVTFNSPIGNWSLAGQTVTLRTTYKVPSDVVVGSELNSGGKFRPSQSADLTFDPLNVCVQVGEKKGGFGSSGSAGSLGSLGSLGFGSQGDGGSSIFGSLGG